MDVIGGTTKLADDASDAVFGDMDGTGLSLNGGLDSSDWVFWDQPF